MIIPNNFFDVYYEIVDELIDDNTIGQTITLHYKSETPRDYDDFLEDTFVPKEEVKTDTMKVRLYTSTKNWIKVANTEFIDGRIQIIGYMSDLEKLTRSSFITHNDNKYKLATNPLKHGFGNRYFVAFLDVI